jgi:hypothetical protein
LALAWACRGQWLFLGALKDAFGHRGVKKAAGATLMRIDLQKINAEITSLRSKLAAINDDLDECRRGYFEHPWAWSKIRRTLTFERNRVQRRIEELTFVCRCVGARPRDSAATVCFRSLARLGEWNTEGPEHLDQATFDLKSNRLTLRLIQGGRS